MDDHTLRVLEYADVLDLLARETAFSIGRELALEVRPAVSLLDARRLQERTAEGRLLDQQGIDIPFSGAHDIRPLVRSAEIGQALDPDRLLEAAATLKTAWRAKQTIEKVRMQVPSLGEIADGVNDFRRFADAVDEAITARGEVADSASDQLGTIRRELRVAIDRLEQRAQAALADAVRRGIAQEGLLTERNGRKVIPVKADYRGQVQGIVHDVSSSGATVFLEPMAVVEAGNQVRELQLAEDREVRRVLQRLSAFIGERSAEALETVLALGRLDLVVACVRLGRRLKAGLPPPGDAQSWLSAAGETRIVRGRHPLLKGDVVPSSIAIGGDYQGVLITGPNTGGKTVALKTIGLLTLMAQSGLPVPCDDSSHMVVFAQIFADIGDEQSIQQSLSTFSSHVRNIKSILDRAGPGTLVLLDELGAGTDPTEGAALARAIVDALLERGCTVIATTHHGELKAFAHSDPRLRNASVEFDLETLSPTYHLTVGLPGQSNAIAIARRLGIGEEVLSNAEEQLSPDHFELEGMLASIRDEREEAARREAEELRLALARRSESIEDERDEILAAAKREAEDEVAAIRREVDALRRRGATRDDARNAADVLKDLDARAARLGRRQRPPPEPSLPAETVRELGPGDVVHVRDIPQAGEALGEVGEDGRVEVQFGGLRMKVSVDRIAKVDPAQPNTRVSLPEVSRPSVQVELDLRGQRAEEALLTFETYLDDAYRAGLPFVRIIHGKGTGALRAAVREALSGHPLVRSFESAPQREGGEGVTVAVLAG